jgi:hypothetical protein
MAARMAAAWTIFRWLSLGQVVFLLSGLGGQPSSLRPPPPPAADFTTWEDAMASVPAELAALTGLPEAPENSGKAQGGPAAGANRTSVKKAWIARTQELRQLEAAIHKSARQQGVDEDLVWAVMRQESGFNSGAVSPKGAMGLMQLMPATAAMLGVTDPFNVEQNVAAGVKYLRICLDSFGQNTDLALAAYNAGPGNVVKHQGVPPFAVTIDYVAAVMRDYAAQTRPRGLRRTSGNSLSAAGPDKSQSRACSGGSPSSAGKSLCPRKKVGAPAGNVLPWLRGWLGKSWCLSLGKGRIAQGPARGEGKSRVYKISCTVS